MKKKIKKILCVTLTLLFLFAIIPDAAFTLEDDPVDEKGLEEIARIQTFLAPLISLAEAIDADLYSEASVQTLQDALATAKTVSTERITQATVGELNQIRKSYNALYSAYYSRLIPKTSFSVHLRYSDNQFARHEVYGNLSIPLCGSGLIETVTVTPGTTLEGLVDQLEIDYSYRQLHAMEGATSRDKGQRKIQRDCHIYKAKQRRRENAEGQVLTTALVFLHDTSCAAFS